MIFEYLTEVLIIIEKGEGSGPNLGTNLPPQPTLIMYKLYVTGGLVYWNFHLRIIQLITS